MLSRCFLDFSVGVRASVIGLSQISSFSLAFVLMLRPFFPELFMSADLLSFEHPSVLLFCLLTLNVKRFYIKGKSLTLNVFCLH